MLSFKDLVLKELEQAILSHSETVLNGSFQTMREYGLAAGYIQGLKEARTILETQWDDYVKKTRSVEIDE